MIMGRSVDSGHQSLRNLSVMVMIYGYHTIPTCDNRVIININDAAENNSRMTTLGI